MCLLGHEAGLILLLDGYQLEEVTILRCDWLAISQRKPCDLLAIRGSCVIGWLSIRGSCVIGWLSVRESHVTG